MATQAGARGPVVTFGKDESLLAISVGFVQEILDRQDMSWLPGSPPHVLGLIDVRGAMVPVIDLRALLGEPPRPDGIDTRILVLRWERHEGLDAVALRVDRVIEVTSLDEVSEPLGRQSPESVETGLLDGIGRRNGKFVSLLAAERLFAPALLSEALNLSQPSPMLRPLEAERTPREQRSLVEHAGENA